MAYWSINCWDDVGGPEDGIIIHKCRTVVEAETAEGAWNVTENGCYKYDENNVATPDIRPATEDEIDEYEMERQEEENFKAKYGCYPWEV